MRNLKGYTLVELMIIIAIVAALAGLAIPAFSHYILEAEGSSQKANSEASYRETRADAIFVESRAARGE